MSLDMTQPIAVSFETEAQYITWIRQLQEENLPYLVFPADGKIRVWRFVGRHCVDLLSVSIRDNEYIAAPLWSN